MEWRVLNILRLTDLNGTQIEGHLVIGQIVGIHIAREAIVNGLVDIFRARSICRAGGTGDYFESTAEGYFYMPRSDFP